MILVVDLKVLVKFWAVAVIGFLLSKALDVFASSDIVAAFMKEKRALYKWTRLWCGAVNGCVGETNADGAEPQ